MLIWIFFNIFPATYPSQRYNLPPPFDFFKNSKKNPKLQLFPKHFQNSGVYRYLARSCFTLKSCRSPQISSFPHISFKYLPMFYVCNNIWLIVKIYLLENSVWGYVTHQKSSPALVNKLCWWKVCKRKSNCIFFF